MAEAIVLEASPRTELGTGASRRMRRAELIPAVIYGANQQPESITIEHRHILKALTLDGFSSSVITLNVADQAVKAVVKSLQRHPFKPKVLHVDFMRIDEAKKITIKVPFHFNGGDVCPGVKMHSGIVSQVMNDIEVTCLPMNLPEYIEVDLSGLDVDQAIHLSQLNLPAGVELVHPVTSSENDAPVASVHVPRGAVEAQAGADDADQ